MHRPLVSMAHNAILSLIAAIIVSLSVLPTAFAGLAFSRTSPSDIDRYMSTHNTVRAQHGAVNLVWNNTLSSAAQRWANGCKFGHSGGSLGPYGGRYLL
jgi:pathogenesis-related protein 1